MTASIIAINSIQIHQDTEGLYRLNDLHKASPFAGLKHKAPNKWLGTQQAQEIVEESQTPNSGSGMKSTTYRVVNGGNAPGVYGSKAILLSYAMWLSAKFHLHVVDVFDRATSGPQLDPQTELLVRQVYELAAVKQKQVEHDSRLAALEAHASADTGYMTISAWGKVNRAQLPLNYAKRLGAKCTGYCRMKGMRMGSVPDERWGHVNSYPAEVIDEMARKLFSEEY